MKINCYLIGVTNGKVYKISIMKVFMIIEDRNIIQRLIDEVDTSGLRMAGLPERKDLQP